MHSTLVVNRNWLTFASVPLAALLLFTVLLCGCSLRPPKQASNTAFSVYAHEQATADRFLKIATQAAPKIHKYLPGCTRSQVDVWVLGRQGAKRSSYYGGTIRLRGYPEDQVNTLIHELVHASIDMAWPDLPGLVEEGLCNCIAVDVSPERTAALELDLLLSAAMGLGLAPALEYVHFVRIDYPAGSGFTRLGISQPVWLHHGHTVAVEDVLRKFLFLPNSVRINLHDISPAEYGIGYLIAREIIRHGGVESVLALSNSTVRPSPGEIMTAAGHSDANSLLERLRVVFDEDLVRNCARDTPIWLVDVVVDSITTSEAPFQFKHPAWTDVDIAIDQADPRLRLHDGTTIHLGEIAALRAAVKKAWSRRRAL